MTIGTTAPRVIYLTDGVSTVFPVPIQAYAAADFLVLLIPPGTPSGSSLPLVLNSDYTMAASGTQQPPQWTLTTTIAQPVGNEIQIILNPVQNQQAQFVQGQAFPSLAVQTALDRLTQMVQRLQDQVNRSARAPDGDVSPVMLLPSAAGRANMAYGFDASGNSSLITSVPSSFTQSNFNAFLGIAPPYQITPAEIAAGVTPVNQLYPPYNVLRYGADPTGNSAANAAFTSAYAAAQALTPHQPIHVPTGTYQIASPGLLWTTQNDLRMFGDGPNLSVLTGSNSSQYTILKISADTGVGTSGINLNLSNFGIRNHPSAPLTNGLVLADYGYGSLTSIRIQASGNALTMLGMAFMTCTDMNLLTWENNGSGTTALQLGLDSHGTACGPLDFAGCQFEGGGGVTTGAAVQSVMSVATVFRACAFIGFGPGLISVGDFNNRDDVTLIECYSESSTNTSTGGGTLFRLGITAATLNFTMIGGTFFTGDGVHQLDKAIVAFNVGGANTSLFTVTNVEFAGFNVSALTLVLTAVSLIQVSNTNCSGAGNPPVFDATMTTAPTGELITYWSYPPHSTGWGVPAGPAVVANFPATPTLGQCGQAIGQIINMLKARGFEGL